MRQSPMTTLEAPFLPFSTLCLSCKDCVGEQFLAHVFYFGIAGPVCKVQFDELASANVIYATKAKPFQRMVDGLSLRVQDAAFQCHENAGFHIGRFPEM